MLSVPDYDPLASQESQPGFPEKTPTDAKGGSKVFSFGNFCLVGLIASWVAQSEICQYLQTKVNYDKPYAIVWFNHSFTALLLPIQILYYYARFCCCDESIRIERLKTSDARPSGWPLPADYTPLEYSDEDKELVGFFKYAHVAHGVEYRSLIKTCLWLSTLYLMADYVYYAALPDISVAVATCLFNTSCVFAYGFSVLLLDETLSFPKLLGVALALGGAVVTSIAPGKSNVDGHVSPEVRYMASAFVLTSAALYGLYETLYKKYQPNENTDVVNMVSGLIGVVSALLFWVGLPLVHFLPNCIFQETLQVPSGREFSYLLLNASAALIFNMLLMLSISITSPLLVSVACMATIPVSGVADWMLWGDQPGLQMILGSCLVLLGFGLLVWSDNKVR
ncbi:hypothetical protein CYMTET_55412 [Cymbomonas tetramitiformis]|uniref:EamA domain-containing protein n=1 Tax=Cymbomonas tetramitiformis TaxID=36881 RepID=A0AAE0BDE0_9CHLO|nr:hypothetical protein CYMTET_55412 [Cymbomonas tetramitiformis]